MRDVQMVAVNCGGAAGCVFRGNAVPLFLMFGEVNDFFSVEI